MRPYYQPVLSPLSLSLSFLPLLRASAARNPSTASTGHLTTGWPVGDSPLTTSSSEQRGHTQVSIHHSSLGQRASTASLCRTVVAYIDVSILDNYSRCRPLLLLPRHRRSLWLRPPLSPKSVLSLHFKHARHPVKPSGVKHQRRRVPLHQMHPSLLVKARRSRS